MTMNNELFFHPLKQGRKILQTMEKKREMSTPKGVGLLI